MSDENRLATTEILPADELAAIGARTVTYERAAQAYAACGYGDSARRLAASDAAHESAADVPALLRHLRALDAAHAAAVAAERERVADELRATADAMPRTYPTCLQARSLYRAADAIAARAGGAR